ncbi:MAG: site-specific integrase [Pseudomonadota bacterium]
MSLYKRKDSSVWWVKLSHKGRRLQESTGTSDKRKAQEFHDKRKSELWEQERLGVKPSHMWEEAVLRYLDESGHKASIKDDKLHLRWLQKHLESSDLASINRDVVDRLTRIAKAERVSNATVNRRLAVLRAILRRAAFDWEWMDRCPKVRLLPEAKGRVRFLTPPEAQRLLKELPEHLRAMAGFSLCTGLRQANVKGLKWSQVDMERGFAWVAAHEAKAGKGIAVPLNADALKVLRSVEGKHADYVFTYQGKPIRQVGTKAWRGALKRAEIENFRWHDLRHTWASWHVQSGTPTYALQELGGWASTEMVRRYAHLSANHLANYAERFAQNAPLPFADSGYVLATVPSG